MIQYADGAFSIDYTDDLEESLLDVIADMREGMFMRDVNRSHGNGRVCGACGVREVCDQRLVD